MENPQAFDKPIKHLWNLWLKRKEKKERHIRKKWVNSSNWEIIVNNVTQFIKAMFRRKIILNASIDKKS